MRFTYPLGGRWAGLSDDNPDRGLAMDHNTVIPLTVIPANPSGNAKTGPIGVSYRTVDTCPATCPFLDSGCYGTGRLWGYANRAASGMTVGQAIDAIRKASRKGARYFRDRVLGDIDGPDGIGYLAAIAYACGEAGVRPFGYTHAWRTLSADDVQAIRDSGYVMNASCETLEDIRAATELGLDPVLVNDNIADGTRVAGRTVVQCPEQTGRVKNCAECGMCAMPDRRNVIRFGIHGTAKRAAHDAIDRL